MIAFALGVFSLFLVAVDVVMLTDIGKEYMLHNVTGEWNILFVNHGIHALFALVSIIQCVDDSKHISTMTSMPEALVDEATFLSIHQIGVFSSLCGFLSIITLIRMSIAETYLTGLLLIASFVLSLPYAIAVLYWFITKHKEKPVEWYDEKQFLDISRGALVSLIVIVALTIGLFLTVSLKLMVFNLVLIFPIYLFVMEFCFSGSALYFSKRG